MSHSPHAFLVNGEVFFDPHPKQAEVIELLKQRVTGTGPEPANVFLWGNRGGGKSRLMRAFCHALAMAFPGFKYAVVRRNMPDLHKNHLIYLDAEMRKLGGSFHQTQHQANYENGSIGFYSQCEEERDVEKVVGAEVALLFVDEAPQIKWEYLRMMGPSLRVPKGTDGKQPYRTLAVYGGNPVGESIDELWKYFVDQDVDPYEDPEYQAENFQAIEIHLRDNPSLDPNEYRKQFAGLPAHYRKAWLDGVRMDARTLFDVRKQVDGKPYHYIQELPTVGDVPLLKVPWIQIYRAFDMGFFPDPAVCVWLAVLGRRVIAVHEETWFKTIAKDLAANLRSVTTEMVGDTRVAMTYVDPAIDVKTGSDTVTVMDTLEMNGIPCEASINDRVLYADAIHGLLGEEVEPGVPRFQVYEPGCPMLAKYLPKMRWDEKNPRKMADHKFDHWVVALAYFAISSGVLSHTQEQETRTEPVWMQWMREGTGKRRSLR
jgi:hypothetical protein